MYKNLTFAITAIISVTAASAQAAVIAEYNFNAGNGVSTDSETLTSAGVYSMVYYSPSPGTVAFTNTFDGSLALGSIAATSSTDRNSNPTLADALNTVDFPSRTQFHQFSITIPAGIELSLSSIEFDWGFAQTALPGNTAGPTLQLVSTATGSTILASDSFTVPANPTEHIFNADGTGSLKPYSIALSGQSSLQSLSGTTLTFLFALGETSNIEAPGRGFVMDNVILNGTASSIPEPSTTAAILGIACVGLLSLRRRAKNEAKTRS